MPRVSVQGVESLGGHFATIFRKFDFYEGKKNINIFKKKIGKYVYTLNHFQSEKSSKKQKSTNLTTMNPCRNKHANESTPRRLTLSMAL